MLLSICNDDIVITIYGWFGGHAETCLGVAWCGLFVGGDMYGYGFIKKIVLFRTVELRWVRAFY